MGTSLVRIGIAGCGLGARIRLDRLLALDGVAIAGCADPDLQAARALADRASLGAGFGSAGTAVPAFADHRELLRQIAPDALAIFAPQISHYRLATDALQAGCHVFIEKPLSTNVQEATDFVSLARGRNLKVGVDHPFRLCPSLVEARRRLAAGAIGPVRLVTATLTRPWFATSDQNERTGRSNPLPVGSGILANSGGDLIDVLLWTTGQVAREAAAFQSRRDPGIDVITAAAIRLSDGTPVALATSGISPGTLFLLDYFGELGRLRATEQNLEEERFDEPRRDVPLPAPSHTIAGNFVAAITSVSRLCCPADEALDTVRLLDAIARSAPTGQIVRLI